MVQTIRKIDTRSYLRSTNHILNGMAIGYTLLAYGVSVYLLTLSNAVAIAVGMLLLTHSLVYSAYLSHECMHRNLFRSHRWDTGVGYLMLWLNGGCYFGFRTLAIQHMEHHVCKSDVMTFDAPAEIHRQYRWVQQIILMLEWLYIPVVAVWMRWRGIIQLWGTAESQWERFRIVGVFILRSSLFALYGFFSVRGLLLYCLCYMGMITMLRFADAFQHTYEGFPSRQQMPKRDEGYEQANTFSNLLSVRFPQLNLLFLNFGYHSAHHAVMQCPWYSLHKLDQELIQDGVGMRISLSQQIRNYHRFRVVRLLKGQGDVGNPSGEPVFENFYGASDVSFITVY